MFWSTFTLAFYGFLRASEFTCPTAYTFNSKLHLRTSDISVNDQQTAMSVLIKGSKTDKYRQSTTLHIAATSTSTCPVRDMQKYLSSYPLQPKQPLFVTAKGKYLTRETFTAALRNLLEGSGWPPQEVSNFSSHSFRIGAATEAAAIGLPAWPIQRAGRWKSDAYKGYIRTPPTATPTIAPRIARSRERK